MERKYLLDTNVVLQLGAKSLSESRFFVQHCQLIDDVIDELDLELDWDAVRYPTTARLLQVLISVMATIPVGDISLIDLYRNKGRADPVIIAAALDAIEEDRGSLMGEVREWVVVSEDQAVRRTCADFGIPTVGLEEMRELLTDSCWGDGRGLNRRCSPITGEPGQRGKPGHGGRVCRQGCPQPVTLGLEATSAGQAGPAP